MKRIVILSTLLFVCSALLAQNNKAIDPISNSNKYLNGESPKVTCITIEDMMDLYKYDKESLEDVKGYLKTKGYTFQWREYSQYHFVKNCAIDQSFYFIKSYDDLLTASHVAVELLNEETRVSLFLYDNDKLCAYLASKIEQLGYTIKYKYSRQLEFGTDYIFMKDPNGAVFRISSQKPLPQAKVPKGTIQYMIQFISPAEFKRVKMKFVKE